MADIIDNSQQISIKLGPPKKKFPLAVVLMAIPFIPLILPLLKKK